MTDVSKSIRWVSKEISYRSDPQKFFEALQKIWPLSFIYHSSMLHAMLSEGEARLSTTRQEAYEAEESDVPHEVVLDANIESCILHSLILDTSLVSKNEALDMIIFMTPRANIIARESDDHISFNYDTDDIPSDERPLISITEYLDDDPYQPLA